MMTNLLDLGIAGTLIFLILLVILIPGIVTVIVGIGFANIFGFTGIMWWAFVILFYIIIMAILSALAGV